MKAIIAFIALLVFPYVSSQRIPEKQTLDQAGLDQVEDLSESLANALLDFSVAIRDKNLDTAESYFDDPVEMNRLSAPVGAAWQTTGWLRRQTIDLSGDTPARVARQEMSRRWGELLTCFSEIEDARFKVSESSFRQHHAGVEGRTALKFFLVGRDEAGKRLWVKGTGRLKARQAGGERWLISSMIFQHIDWIGADLDLFSEVSSPAGVALSLPPYGSAGNDQFGVYAGAAAGDLDGDGLIDLVVTSVSGLYLYRNLGDGTFRNISSEVGLPPRTDATAPLLLDYDNDGDLDVFFASVGPQMLFENRLIPEGKLSLLDVSLESGVALKAIGFSATAADVNGDSWTDIYVTSYNLYGRVMPNSWHQATNGTANLLFMNQGDGSFKELAAQWGVQDKRWSYAAQFADVNRDGRPDLYVANDFGENALYLHRGERYEEAAASNGVLDPGNGMGVSFGDFNNDGHLDLYVTNMSSTAGSRILRRLFPEAKPSENVLWKLALGNTLFQGDGSGSFTDVTLHKGPFTGGWAWGGVFLDVDNDGWDDLFSTNGFISGKSMHDT